MQANKTQFSRTYAPKPKYPMEISYITCEQDTTFPANELAFAIDYFNTRYLTPMIPREKSKDVMYICCTWPEYQVRITVDITGTEARSATTSDDPDAYRALLDTKIAAAWHDLSEFVKQELAKGTIPHSV